jgi:hypothetical protein
MTDKIVISIMVSLPTEPVAPSDVRPNDDEEKYAEEDAPDIPHGISPFPFQNFFSSHLGTQSANRNAGPAALSDRSS